jgi:tetratricopeptide (TPR) repeat protein
MPLRKKIGADRTAGKSGVKRLAVREPVTSKPTRKNGKVTPVSSKSGTAAVPQPIRPPAQLASFEAGIKLFHGGKFREARERFEDASHGSDRGIAHQAELHMKMCDRRLQEQAVVLNTAEDHYNYAITLINARDLNPARRHLEKALEQQPDADHVYYALSLCHGLSGDLQRAFEYLKRAIEIQPRNRIAARQDADFSGIANQPPLDRLLFPERKKSY